MSLELNADKITKQKKQKNGNKNSEYQQKLFAVGLCASTNSQKHIEYFRVLHCFSTSDDCMCVCVVVVVYGEELLEIAVLEKGIIFYC